MDKQKLTQVTSQLNKQLDYLLNIFDRNKEWADIGNWLFKVEQALNEYRSPFIKERFTFGKRLAQCLNPKLPVAIHSSVLKIYEIVFENIKLSTGGFNKEYNQIFSQNISVYCVGLFPFFKNAATKNKFTYVELIKKYFIPLQIELIPCLPGLMLALLPVLEENNDQLNKELYELMDLINRAVGRR